MRFLVAFKTVLALLGLLALFASGLAIRRAVLEAQVAVHGRDLPFNLESALEFRYVRMLFAGQSLPDVDDKIQVPGGLRVRETYTLGAEYVYALAARAFPAGMDLAARTRWVAAGWFCLGIPLLSLGLWWWLKSAWAAGIGGAYYAVSLASVMRSTGEELSHENFALPILIGSLALSALAEGRRSAGAFLSCALLSAVLLAWALASWDLVQFYVLVWAILHAGRLLRGTYFDSPRRRQAWGLALLSLAAAGLLNPYLRAHGFLASPAMLLAYGTAAGLGLDRALAGGRARISLPWTGWRRRLALALPTAAALALGLLLAGAYAGAYGHFWELLQAKLVFFNRKPADPGLLTFAQRILWAPALNSATWRLTASLFPATLPLFVLTAIVICVRARWRSDPKLIHLLWLCALSLPAYILFVRFHVFVIIGFSALLGWAAWWASDFRAAEPDGGSPGLGGWVRRGAVLALLLAGVGVEAANVLHDPVRWGANPGYGPQKKELVQWLVEHQVTDPVLANFGISAFLLAYADCPIVLHPKFESEEARRRVQAYGEALFLGNEARFRDWAEPYGAAWYVHSLGEFAARQPELQMRYHVNALCPPETAAARLFETHPGNGRYFQWLWGNGKYRVFRIIRRADEREAGRIAGEAEADLARGALADADLKAGLALLYDPHSVRAREVLLRAEALRDQGGVEAGTAEPRSRRGQ